MCVLHVSSKTMSFGDFIEGSSLPIYRSHEKGDPGIIPRRPAFADYGFSCKVSKKKFSDFKGQVKDAISFLNTNLHELTTLVEQYEIDNIRLDFPIENRMVKMDLASQCDYLPPELIKLAGNIGLGIEMSQYWPANEE